MIELTLRHFKRIGCYCHGYLLSRIEIWAMDKKIAGISECPLVILNMLATV
jgi:hypothetical protein